MNTSQLKQFAQNARRQLIELVSTKLTIVLDASSAARRENEKAVKDLKKEISRTSEDQVIEKVAYIWFNRFCALRFMDVNRYTSIGVVSPSEGFSQPEILMEAKQGHIDAGLRIDKDRVFGLLNETIPSPEPQQEAYRMILVAVCNDYNSIMPFLFEKIADYTELLMPDDLLSDSSILTATREALSEEACADVEVIGWLYQFYISEKKDEVFAELKKNKKVTPENIPAATQLFTPNWIVRYLVENSLGRLWMLNNPGSNLIDRMEYYIKPEQEETDFLVINSPEEIKICDPACGSGHMLVYAFEILYAIYEEEGYDAPKIPQLILEKNLYGIEIDERAGELAAFSLFMKAREKYRRFFRKTIQPNICVLENISFESHEIKNYLNTVNPDLFTMDLQTLLYQFKEADNFGSLIRPELTNIPDVLRLLDEKKVSDDMFLQDTHKRVLKILNQADYLSPKYHIVVANPPYMGGGGMNGRLGKWVQDNYPESKADLFAIFIDRNLNMVLAKGLVAMITMQSWMFLSSFAKLRFRMINEHTILSMMHLGARAFDSIGGEVVSTTAFIMKKYFLSEYEGNYLRLIHGNSESEKKMLFFQTVAGKNKSHSFHVSSSNFKAIPGSPIAYWIGEDFIAPFKKCKKSIYDLTISDGQTKTGNNDKYLRQHWEVSRSDVGIKKKWLQHPKGGPYRKWYGNLDWVIDWSDNARKHYRKDRVARILPEYLWGRRGVSWTLITTGAASFRILESDQIFNLAAPSLFFHDDEELEVCLGFLNTQYSVKLLNVMNPTLNLNVGEVRSLPMLEAINAEKSRIKEIVRKCVNLSKIDWNESELSLHFSNFNLITVSNQRSTIKESYGLLKEGWYNRVKEIKYLEEDNNRIFIKAYNLENVLVPDIPISDITLNCNPHYRYSDKKKEIERDKLLRSDTVKDFLSYSVGCMFGRYSLDKPGIIIADRGATIEDYYSRIPKPTFEPDDDNVIPIMDVDWFSDDIAERFKRFLKVTFGEEHYTENLGFIEKAIGKNLRKYFLKDFYTYHLRMYKKRPIYWMFSSPKGNFNALIYMHRYRPDTVSIILNDYLREFRTKLTARKDNLENISNSTSASQGEKTKALKEIENIKKIIEEVNEYERDILYPLATKQVEIELDDGIKTNYKKFGKALKEVTGLSKK